MCYYWQKIGLTTRWTIFKHNKTAMMLLNKNAHTHKKKKNQGANYTEQRRETDVYS